jgi:hypothetical protein
VEEGIADGREPVLSEAEGTPVTTSKATALYFWLYDFHAADQVLTYLVNMLDHSVHQNFSPQIANNLMDIDYYAAFFIRREALRFNMRIYLFPLASPVVANGFMSMYTSTFHPVWPIDIGMHVREN